MNSNSDTGNTERAEKTTNAIKGSSGKMAGYGGRDVERLEKNLKNVTSQKDANEEEE